MKDIAIQLDRSSVRKAEDFVAAICYENHLENYHATIAVPVLKAVEQLLQVQDNLENVSPINLECGFCQEGISFTVTGKVNSFSVGEWSKVDSADHLSDAACLARMLADEVEVFGDGSSLRMVFYVRGIDAVESNRRITVLNHFYAPSLVEV